MWIGICTNALGRIPPPTILSYLCSHRRHNFCKRFLISSALTTPRFCPTKCESRYWNHKVSASAHIAAMAPISLADIVSTLPSDESWGPTTTTEALVDGVPYAPYSKGDKLGRMADWTSEGKDGRDGRGGRQQYNRNYRGPSPQNLSLLAFANSFYCRSTSIWCWNV